MLPQLASMPNKVVIYIKNKNDRTVLVHMFKIVHWETYTCAESDCSNFRTIILQYQMLYVWQPALHHVH